MSEAKESGCDSSTRSSSILQTSRLNTAVRSSMLRPSLFGSQLNASSATGLGVGEETKSDIVDDPKVNPFLKDTKNDDEEEKLNDNKNENDKEKDKTEQKSDPLSLLTKNGLPKSNLFTAKTSIPLAESSGFVFGQNVHERVTGEIQSTSSVGNSTKTENENSDMSSSSSSNLLFSSAIQNKDETPKETESRSLTEVAREYEESRAQKRKYEEVETFTGEENEVNVVDLNCKIFAFVNCNWEERGRGSLRLNDSKDKSGSSRVVFRTSGNLRLLLNTKIWSGMVAERPSQKSLRLTAMDNTGQIKIFLIMSRPDDINTLFNALTKRIETHKAASSESIDDEQKNGSEKEKESVNNDSSDTTEPSPKKVAVETNN